MSSPKVYSGVTYSSPSVGTTNFALTSDAGNAIEYLSQDHIKVESSTDAGVTWTELTVTTDYTFTSNGTEIALVTPTVEDQQIRITRNTPLSAQYVTFSDGSLLTSKQLNKAEQFSLFCDQEIVDGGVDFDPSDIGLDDTDDLPEGSVNLYYTDARVEAWVNANFADTDSLPEGSTNLYYTDERVEAYVSGQGYIKDAGVTRIIAGTNVAISPTSGVGEVTITSIGGGGGGGGFIYKGEIDATQPAPGGPANGDLYVNTATGVVGSGWTGIVGEAITGNERLIYSDVGSWALLVDNGIPDAPSDGKQYGRQNLGWTEIPSIPTVTTPNLQEVTDQGGTTTNSITAGGFITTGSINSGYIKANNSINANRSGDFEAFTAQENDTKNVIIKAGGDATFTGNIEAAGFRIDLLTTLP